MVKGLLAGLALIFLLPSVSLAHDWDHWRTRKHHHYRSYYRYPDVYYYYPGYYWRPYVYYPRYGYRYGPYRYWHGR